MKKKNRIICITLLLSLMLSLFLPFTVSAEESNVSDVLDDLGKDASFNAKDYPGNATDYSMNFITLAEGDERELFIYVYQPSNGAFDLTAKYINMSTRHFESKDQNYKLYSLTLVDSTGVFNKYVVDNFKVSRDTYRYYNIATIYRYYDARIDGANLPGSGDTIGQVGYPVGKFVAAYNSYGNVVYEAKNIDVVDVDITSVGTVRYSNGIQFSNTTTKCDSHFVAFKINNYDVTDIFDATVSYIIADCVINYGIGDSTPKLSNEEIITVDIYDYEKGSNTGDGIWGYKYIWDRIQTFSEFDSMLSEYTNEKIVYEEESIRESDFVFSFLETDFNVISGSGYTTYMSKRVTDVGILRLHFATDTGVYNLGVVGDLVYDDGEPDVEIGVDDNVENIKEELEGMFDDFIRIFLIIVLVVAVIFAFSVGKPILKIIFRGFTEIIGLILSFFMYPFHLLGKLFKGK